MPFIIKSDFLNPNDLPTLDAYILFFNENKECSGASMLIDSKFHGVACKFLASTKEKKCKFGQSYKISHFVENTLVHVILICTGDQSKLTSYKYKELGGKIFNFAKELNAKTIGIATENKKEEEFANLIDFGANLANYNFNKYKQKTEETQEADEEIVFKYLNVKQEEFDLNAFYYNSIAEGTKHARDFVSEPPNVLYPDSYANRILELLEPLDVEIEILGEREMKNLQMGALVGVGQGSSHESKMVIMIYNGNPDKEEYDVSFIGKGVTFDTGGISLKPANGMEDMKYDMAGSAAVVGTMYALAKRKAKINAIGAVGLVENMPGGNAQRPSDVVMTMSGKTVEVLNTDAEGRLVLADVMWYTQDRFKPEIMIDLATLTGAIVISLGSTYAGIFSNSDELSKELEKAGSDVNEKLWRMPLHEDYDNAMKSQIADLANISSERGAGSSTAANFLQHFIGGTKQWAHLDIAGMAWDKKGKSYCPKGAVGFGVQLLNKFVSDKYESSN